jgi:hypothetical protein
MKSRPRNVENRVAEVMSEWYVKNGFSPVERVPVLGRSGPDISINEMLIAIDVKSRKSIPIGYKITEPKIFQFGALLGVKMKNFQLFFENVEPELTSTASITIRRWFYHMKKWTDGVPNGIPAVVLHWPGTRIDNATILIHRDNKELLNERYSNLQCINRPDTESSLSGAGTDPNEQSDGEHPGSEGESPLHWAPASFYAPFRATEIGEWYGRGSTIDEGKDTKRDRSEESLDDTS